MDNINLILWLQEWYCQNCDGDWEHDQNILITTIDNPGWSVTINLVGTDIENQTLQRTLIEKSKEDWFCCRIEQKKFLGDCGPRNLLDVISVFKDMVAADESKK